MNTTLNHHIAAFKIPAISLAATLLLSITAHTAPSCYDGAGDQYASGNSIVGTNGGFGFAEVWEGSGWGKTKTDSLATVATIAPSEGRAFGGTHGRVARKLSETPITGTFYISFSMQVDATISSSRYYAFELFDGAPKKGDPNRTLQLGLLTQDGTSNNASFEIRLNNSTTNIKPIATSDQETHHVVLKIEKGPSTMDDSISVWLDPTTKADAPQSFSGVEIPFTHIALASFNGGTFLIDEIRTGETWESVSATR